MADLRVCLSEEGRIEWEAAISLKLNRVVVTLPEHSHQSVRIVEVTTLPRTSAPAKVRPPIYIAAIALRCPCSDRAEQSA